MAVLGSFHPEMALFSLSCVLLRFPPATYDHVRLGANRRAALLREKMLISELETNSCPFLKKSIYGWTLGICLV